MKKIDKKYKYTSCKYKVPSKNTKKQSKGKTMSRNITRKSLTIKINSKQIM